MSEDRLQPGVWFRPGERPPPAWRLVLVNVLSRSRPRQVKDAIAALLEMLAGLPEGRVRELEGEPAEGVAATRRAFAGLSGMLGYGASFFDSAGHDPPLSSAARPAFLSSLPTERDPFAAVGWSPRATRDGEADLALALSGPDPAAVNRAAVELCKLIADEALPLAVVASFDGFARSDGRGWLEFRDGVSNIEPSQRARAITAGPDPEWLGGGTSMAFLRFEIDLARWRRLSRAEQELIVGRDKLSGSAVIGVRRTPPSRASPIAGEPIGAAPSPSERADWIEPPLSDDPLVEVSHIHRANRSRASPDAPAALRIYRQGYDFLESIGPDGPRLGLNFVSFQSDLAVISRLMSLPGWFGDANFGGPAEPDSGSPSPRLISLLAGGYYAVPPRGRPIPGAGLFER